MSTITFVTSNIKKLEEVVVILGKKFPYKVSIKFYTLCEFYFSIGIHLLLLQSLFTMYWKNTYMLIIAFCTCF